MSTLPSPLQLSLIAFIPVLAWIVGIILTFSVIIWVFQIRKSTRETAEETKNITRILNGIYNLLREQKKG